MEQENKIPEQIIVKAGTVAFCTCGLSTNQPYCNGAHSTTDKKPFIEKLDKDTPMYFCRCGRTTNAPFCNGEHLNIK